MTVGTVPSRCQRRRRSTDALPITTPAASSVSGGPLPWHQRCFATTTRICQTIIKP